MTHPIDTYIEANMTATLAELTTLCAQPSISATGEGITECAELVARMLQTRGFDASIEPTPGHPVVVANLDVGSDKTIILYNHYDVQPAEPLALWDSPAFEPTIRDGAFYARGAIDDKGNLMARFAALDALKAVDGTYPCNIKFVVEGEEEIGSVNLPPFIRDNADRLAADACIWEFGGVNHEDNPRTYLGLRGICYVELSVRTADVDAHSGRGGSIFPNAAWRLVWALNTLKDADERILIPGFYDNVIPASDVDWDLMHKLPDPADTYKELYGVKEFLKGDKRGAALIHQEVFEPTCTICGLTSGYQGPGSKTVLPAVASAKVDFRLVPNQTPAEILEKLRAHLDANGFEDIEMTFMGGEAPGRTDPQHPFVQMTIDTAREVYQREPVVDPMAGGSGPNHAFLEYLNVPVVTMGASYPGSNVHAPNEHMRLDLFDLAIKHTAHLIKRFASS